MVWLFIENCEPLHSLQELPWPSPVQRKIPPEIFGNALMLMEFCHLFEEHLDLEDFPDGVNLGEYCMQWSK